MPLKHAGTVPFAAVDRVYSAYRPEFDCAIQRVLESGRYILGAEVEAFEKVFAAWCGADSCIGVASGTDAITLALRALEIGEGDAVITVSNTSVATIAAIELAGAKPVLVDVDAKSMTMDPNALDSILRNWRYSQTAGVPKAIIAVHLYGNPCDMDSLCDISARHGIKIIEDCAHAHGAQWRGRAVGTFGAAGAFSFYPTKNLGAFGDGGAVITSDRTVAMRCRMLRQYGWQTPQNSTIKGMNSRLDELQAAILLVRLGHLHEEITARQTLASRYDQVVGRITPVSSRSQISSHAYHMYVISTNHRNHLEKYLHDNGIGTAILYPTPIHQQPAYADTITIQGDGLPMTETLRSQILSLPMHPFLTNDESDKIIATLAAWQDHNTSA